MAWYTASCESCAYCNPAAQRDMVAVMVSLVVACGIGKNISYKAAVSYQLSVTSKTLLHFYIFRILKR